MADEMKFKSSQSYFIGRNGKSKCIGFKFWPQNTVTAITPITSKGHAANCEVSIPNEEIGKFCAHLQTDLTSLVLENISPDCLPLLLGLNPKLDVLVGQVMSK